MTLEQIVNEVRQFAQNHEQINSFFEGELSDNTVKKDARYYRLMIELQPSVIDQGTESFVFRVGVFGKVNSDQSNRINVLSDTRQICTDFIAYFRNNPNLTELRLATPVTITDYVEYSDDAVSGYFMDVTVNQYQGLSYCGLPIEGGAINPNSVKILDQDGNILTELYPGQNYTVEVLRRIIDTIDNNTATIIDPLT